MGDELFTVRSLRVLTTKMAPSVETEVVLGSLNSEALAMVLFHKVALSSLQDGFEETQYVAQYWLLGTLLCTYRSAELTMRKGSLMMSTAFLFSSPLSSQLNDFFSKRVESLQVVTYS